MELVEKLDFLILLEKIKIILREKSDKSLDDNQYVTIPIHYDEIKNITNLWGKLNSIWDSVFYIAPTESEPKSTITILTKY